MQVSELIEAVKKHPELYDTKHVNYLRKKLKIRIWNDIAKKLKLKEGDEAKLLWLKLRARYRDARRRYNKCIEEGMIAADIKSWRHMDEMSFLEPFTINVQLKKNKNKEFQLNDDPTAKSKNVLGKDDPMSEGVTAVKMDVYREIIDENRISLDAPENPICSEIGIPSFIETTSICAKKKSDLNNVLSLLNISLLARETRTKEREKRILWEEKETMNDALHTFFMSMYQITKRMPLQHQHNVRSQIFQAVSNAEANILNLSVEQQIEIFLDSKITDLPPLLKSHHEHQIEMENLSETFISNNQNIIDCNNENEAE